MKINKIGKNLHFTISFVTSPNHCSKPSFYLDFQMQIAECTADHSTNHLHGKGNLHFLHLSMD
jgi:hypothetical protein